MPVTIGPGFIIMPAPPPYGASSVTWWWSVVKSRRLWTCIWSKHRSCARCRILACSGEVNMSGKMVKMCTSICPSAWTAVFFPSPCWQGEGEGGGLVQQACHRIEMDRTTCEVDALYDVSECRYQRLLGAVAHHIDIV